MERLEDISLRSNELTSPHNKTGKDMLPEDEVEFRLATWRKM
jgi:hypothetical protein